MKRVMAIVGSLVLAHVVWASNPATDDASDPAYGLGWLNGSNGGSGFGAWSLTTSGSVAGHFLGNSTGNADALDDGNVNGLAGDGDINTGALVPVAWGMYAGSGGNVAGALRPFTGGALSVGQSFSVDFDNGFVEPGGRIILALLDPLSSPVFTVSFVGGTSQYAYSDAGGSASTGLNYGDEGLMLTFSLTGPTAYQATLLRFDGVSTSWAGTLNAAPDRFGAQAIDIGGGVQRDFFINSMAIIPEPSTILLGATGLLGIALRAIRRRAV